MILSSSLIRDINAVCDFILEASDWAKSLVLLPEEQRGPLYGLPVIIIIIVIFIVVIITITIIIFIIIIIITIFLIIIIIIMLLGVSERVLSCEGLRRHHWPCSGLKFL